MYATVSTWHLVAPGRPVEEQYRLLREVVAGGIGIVRGFGVLDVVVVELEPDRLVIAALYDTLEDAMAAEAPIVAYMAERFRNRVELISRSTGPAWEPAHFGAVDRDDAQQWRTDANGMYASIGTWRLDPSLRDTESLTAFLQGLADQVMSLLARLGLLDFLVVRLTEDTLFALRLFGDPEAFEAARAEAQESVPTDILAGKMELIDRVQGRAFDAAQLLAEW
jgi:hypothetical protein